MMVIKKKKISFLKKVSVFYQIIFYSAISQQIILIENKDNFKYLDGLREKVCSL
jgi:hypothetical protein